MKTAFWGKNLKLNESFLLFFPGVVFNTKGKSKLYSEFPFGLLCSF